MSNVSLNKAVSALETAVAYAEDGAVLSAIARVQDALVYLKSEKNRRVRAGLIREEARDANPRASKWPELDAVAESLARETAIQVNLLAQVKTASRCQFKKQYTLEKLIELLQEKV